MQNKNNKIYNFTQQLISIRVLLSSNHCSILHYCETNSDRCCTNETISKSYIKQAWLQNCANAIGLSIFWNIIQNEFREFLHHAREGQSVSREEVTAIYFCVRLFSLSSFFSKLIFCLLTLSMYIRSRSATCEDTPTMSARCSCEGVIHLTNKNTRTRRNQQ